MMVLKLFVRAGLGAEGFFFGLENSSYISDSKAILVVDIFARKIEANLIVVRSALITKSVRDGG